MLVLGMRKKQFLLLITAEYLLSWVISLMAGLLLGKAFSLWNDRLFPVDVSSGS